MSDADADSDAGANTDADADADIQLLRRPETLTQLCDIVAGPFDGPLGHDIKRIAVAAAAKGRGVSPELWAAGMWAITRVGIANDLIVETLALIVAELRACVCSDYYCPTECQVNSSAWELVKIAYMVCPKDSPVFPFILYYLANWMPGTLRRSAVDIRASIGGEMTTLIYGDLLAATLSHPDATARLRAMILCDQAYVQWGRASSVELLYRAHEIDPTYIVVYGYLSYFLTFSPTYVIRLRSRVLNRWGLALEAATSVVGRMDDIIYTKLNGVIPELNGTVISLGDSSMSVFDYICALETPAGSVFHPKMLTDMLPADTPWSCRRHEALDRRTGANALFATFLCALARLEGPGGPLRPSHQTMWEHALESWTLGDSARMYKALAPGEY